MDELSNTQDRGVLIQGLSEQVEKHRSAIEALSKDATHVSSTSRSSVLLLMTAAFKDFKTLADSVAGDYESRAKQDSKLVASIPATLISSLEDALAQSLSASEHVRSDLLKVLDIRAQLGASEKQLQDVQSQISSEKTGLENELNTQSQVVAQADADRIVALQGYEKVKTESDEAAKDAKWWDEHANHQPWWAKLIGGFNPNAKDLDFDKRLIALQKKKAADDSAESLSQRRRQLAEANFKYQELQVRVSELDATIARLKLTEGLTSKAIQECESTISFCRQTEGLMVQCKSNTTIVRSKCAWLEELVTKKDYIQTKADYVDVLLDCIQYGVFDVSLAAIGKTILEDLDAGDQSHLLQEKDAAQKVSNIKRILTGFDRLNIPSTFQQVEQ